MKQILMFTDVSLLNTYKLQRYIPVHHCLGKISMIGYKLSPLLWKHIKTDKKGLANHKNGLAKIISKISDKHKKKFARFARNKG